MRSIVQADGKVLPNNGGINVCCTQQLQAFIVNQFLPQVIVDHLSLLIVARVSLRIIPI
jgi:hypothetical protein